MTTLDATPLMVALVQTASLLPTLLFGLVGGVLADTRNRRTVLLFTQNRILDLTRGEDLQSHDRPSASSDTKSQKLIDLVCKVCVRPAVGFFSIASQISPNGAGDFEDLSILDPNDAGQLLLVIITRQGDDYVVFRRMYHKGS